MVESLYSAPWTLTGKGYILVYKYTRSFVEAKGNIPDFLKGRFAGAFGSVMIVDYKSSNVGPYGELLFIPGRFQVRNRKCYTISKIYVSTMQSVANGVLNWGIPKEYANFKFEAIDRNVERLSANSESGIIAEFLLKSSRISFPINTRLLPFRFELVQNYKENYFYTKISGNGNASLAKLVSVNINPELFPDISHCQPIFVIKIDPFKLIFPIPKIESAEIVDTHF